MINIIKEEIEIEESLESRLRVICDFCNTTPTFINGSIKKIEHTNLSYIEHHRILINGINFLAFNYSKSLYVGNLQNNIEFNELKENKKNIAKLEKENYKLKQTIEDLNYQINENKEEISKLKSNINNLKQTISYWKDKFDKLISFLHSKIHNWYDKDDKNLNVINDMYKDEVLDDEDIEDIELGKKKMMT